MFISAKSKLCMRVLEVFLLFACLFVVVFCFVFFLNNAFDSLSSKNKHYLNQQSTAAHIKNFGEAYKVHVWIILLLQYTGQQ